MGRKHKPPKLSDAAQKHACELREAQLELHALRAKHILRRVKESFAFDGYGYASAWHEIPPITPAGQQFIPLGSPTAHRHGTNWPFFQNEQQLTRIRDLSRIVYGTGNQSKGLVRGLSSYTIGTGFQTKVSPKEGADPAAAKAADKRITAFLDQWASRVRWGERQQEAFRRTNRDGDGLIVLAPEDDGYLSLRFRWPEQLTQPPGSDFREWSFGVQTPPDDAETKLQYHFASLDNPGEIGELVDADDVVHLVDRETDSGVKRGMPLFAFDTKDAFDMASRLSRNLGEGAAIREAIAYMREHAQAGEDEVQEFVSANADFKVQRAITGQYQNVSKLEPGTVLDIPEGLAHAAPPYNEGTAAHMQIVDLLVRCACARVNAPEWLASANAANMGAYTSSLVAESPFVKGVVADQNYYKARFLGIVNRALALAAASGLIDRADLALVDVDLVPPSPETRNKLEESQRAAIEIPLGVDSRQNYCSAQGRDYDKISADNKAWDDEHGNAGQPLELPGGGGPFANGSWNPTPATQ